MVREYPPAVEDAVIRKYRSELDYWIDNYHFRHKIKKNDLVFADTFTGKLVHALLQILYAKNHVYYPGDGNNLVFTRGFRIRPDDFEKRVTDILYPGRFGDGVLAEQVSMLRELYRDVMKLL